MALNPVELGELIGANIDAVANNPDSVARRKAVLEAIASAIITHILTKAAFAIPVVGGGGGVATGAPGSGAIT